MKIIRNSAKCLKCGDEIESKHVHDFVACTCLNVFVDGGHEYLRYGWLHEGTFELTSITEDSDEAPPA